MQNNSLKLVTFNLLLFTVVSCALPETVPEATVLVTDVESSDSLVANTMKLKPVDSIEAFPAVPENTDRSEFAVFGDWMASKSTLNLGTNSSAVCQIFEGYGKSLQWRSETDTAFREYRPPENGKRVCWRFFTQRGPGVVSAEGTNGSFPRCAHKYGVYKVHGQAKKDMATINVGACKTTVLDSSMASDFSKGALVDIQIGFGERTISTVGFEQAYEWAMDHTFDLKSSEQVLKDARERRN